MGKEGKYSNPITATINGIRDLYKKKADSVEIPRRVDLSEKKNNDYRIQFRFGICQC
jgi:hypothetical protein